jgi:hypothetical protein
MSSVVLYSEEHIAFSKDVIKSSYTLIRMPLDAWVCELGLVIPLSTSSFGAVRTFDGKVTGIKDQHIHTIGLLMRLDGSICNFAFDSMLGFVDKERYRYSYELPTGPGVQWCQSEHDSCEEKAYAALLASEKREDVLKNLETADLLMARQIKWYKMDELTAQINAMHKTKYPNHVIYTAKPKEKTNAV